MCGNFQLKIFEIGLHMPPDVQYEKINTCRDFYRKYRKYPRYFSEMKLYTSSERNFKFYGSYFPIAIT